MIMNRNMDAEKLEYYRQHIAEDQFRLLEEFLSHAAPGCCGDDEIFYPDDLYLQIPPMESHRVIVSPEVAARLRAKEMTALVPISAADLIWMEALAMTEE